MSNPPAEILVANHRSRLSKCSAQTFWVGLASLVAVFAVSGCGDDLQPPSAALPIDFGPPPADLAPPPPSNAASPSTNVSTFPVAPLASADCLNATRAIFEFFSASRGHLHTNNFDEGMNDGYTYEFPMNLFVENIAGTIAVYRCHKSTSETSHFLSTDSKCEGQVSENVIVGYIYAPTAPQPSDTKPWYRSSHGIDHYIHFSATPPSGWALDYKMGYGPSSACKNLATTCQPYPSHYTGYTVNPGPDVETGEYVRYSDRAPNPPWFGAYGRAKQSGSGSDAILTGDWGTNNNVDWAQKRHKAECGYTDWMTGLSSDPSHGGAAHAFRCAMSEFKLGARNFNSNCKLVQAENMGAAGAGAFRNGKTDWDPGYTKYSCAKGSYLAGVSSNPDDWSHLHGLLCCSEPDVAGDDCTTVVLGQPSTELDTSTTVDDNDNIVPYDWDPPWSGLTFPKAECGAGRRMMGATKDKDSRLHAILCCRTPPAPPTRVDVSCCSPQTLQKALANCNADNKTYESDCENIVAPCCNSDPSSDGRGGGVCAAVSGSTRDDATKPDGDPNATAAGTTGNNATSCGASGSPLAWAFGYTKKGGGGNKTFGGGYTGQITLGAGPIYATGDASVVADASLFGHKFDIARAEIHGTITGDDILAARIVVLGKDMYVYPAKSSSQDDDSDEQEKSYTVTFFENTEIIELFAVPITIKGTIAGEVGIDAGVESAGNTLSFNAVPWVDATATCSAALGGGKGRFRLTAGVEGTLVLFNASLETVASVSPFTNHVNYDFHSNLNVTALNGSVQAFLKARLKPIFKKTFKHTLAHWGGLKSTTPLFKYHGCMTY